MKGSGWRLRSFAAVQRRRELAIKNGYLEPRPPREHSYVAVPQHLQPAVKTWVAGKALKTLREAQVGAPAHTTRVAAWRAHERGFTTDKEYALDLKKAQAQNRANHRSHARLAPESLKRDAKYDDTSVGAGAVSCHHGKLRASFGKAVDAWADAADDEKWSNNDSLVLIADAGVKFGSCAAGDGLTPEKEKEKLADGGTVSLCDPLRESLDRPPLQLSLPSGDAQHSLFAADGVARSGSSINGAVSSLVVALRSVIRDEVSALDALPASETALAIARIDKIAKEFEMLEGLSARVHALEAGAVSVKAIDGKIEALERQAGDVDLRLDELSARVSGSQKGQEVLGRSVQTLERSVAELGPALVPALQAGLKVQHSEFAVSVFEKQNVRFSELSNAIEDRCAGLQKDLHELATVSFKDSARLDGAEVKLEQLANTTIAQARDFARDPGDMQRQIDDLAKQLCMLSDAHGKTLDETRSRFQTEVERWHSEFESIKGDLVNMLVGDPSFYGKVPDSIKSHNFSTGSALFEAPVSVDTRACGVPASLISVGNRVVLINLSRQDLNGSIGTAVSFDYDSQRFGVKLDSGRSLSVKQENLVQHVLK